MRIRLEECVPQPRRHELPEHDVKTVGEMGWSGVKNGRLLQLLEQNGLEVLVTADRNIRY